MIPRVEIQSSIHRALARSPIVAIWGPRQSGKTTIARKIALGLPAKFLDLESPRDLLPLENPELYLSSLPGLVVLDEIQNHPILFNVLRVLADRLGQPGKFLILGSASPTVMKKVSETLAGRVEFIEMGGFHLNEVGSDQLAQLWDRGGFPRSFLAHSRSDSAAWREGFIRTFLERDIPQLGMTLPAPTLRRFWTMVAHYHGQIWNGSEFARSMGLSEKTLRHYLDILTGTYMVRPLVPWHENLKKRQVKSPKIYLRDTGLLHSLLGIENGDDLQSHPKVGASFEGLAIEELAAALFPTPVYFWSTYTGAELDLFFIKNGKRYGVEVKYSETPRVTPSMRMAINDLALEKLWVVYPGPERLELAPKIELIPLKTLAHSSQGGSREKTPWE